MGVITTKQHAIINYILGSILTFSPWLFNFDAGGAATCIPWLFGLIIILYTMLRNEFGPERGFSLTTYCIIDSLIGLMIGVSPWLFGFSDYVHATHLLSGLSLSINAFLTAPINWNKIRLNVLKKLPGKINKNIISSVIEMILNKNKNLYNNH